MKKFVRIQSAQTISVTPGLLCINDTDENSKATEKLTVRQMWSTMTVKIKAGVGYYPSVVAQWNDTKALSAKGIFTIGETVDEVPEQFAKEANEIYAKLNGAIRTYDKAKEVQKKKLAAKEGNIPTAKKENTEKTLLD